MLSKHQVPISYRFEQSLFELLLHKGTTDQIESLESNGSDRNAMHKKEMSSLTKIFGKKCRKICTYSSSKADNPWRSFGGSFSSRLPLNRLHYENDKKGLNLQKIH